AARLAPTAAGALRLGPRAPARLHGRLAAELSDLEDEPAPASGAFKTPGATMTYKGMNPLSDEQWAHLKAEIVREARRTLVARRFLGIYGPLGAGIESV